MTRPTRITLRYDGGSKDGQVEEFQLADDTELQIGWDSTSTIRFAESEDLVSRRHARIVTRSEGGSRIEILDLGSSSGTFVNQQRVSDFMILRSGDVVQIGAGGPQMRLELEAVHKADESRITGNEDALVEPMISEVGPSPNRRSLAVAGVLLVVVALVIIFLIVRI